MLTSAVVVPRGCCGMNDMASLRHARERLSLSRLGNLGCAGRGGVDVMTAALAAPMRRRPLFQAPPFVSIVGQLAAIAEIWLQKQRSTRTRRAYDPTCSTLLWRAPNINSIDDLRQMGHKAVIIWERFMRKVEHAALSSLFRHVIDYDGAACKSGMRGGVPGGQSAGRRNPGFFEGASKEAARPASRGYG